MKMKLTKTAIDSIKPPAKGRLTIMDVDTPGFALRITSNNSRAYYACRWSFKDRQMKWVRLGEVGELTLDRARTRAREENGKIREGQDPNAEKRADREAATLSNLWISYLDTYARPHKKASSVAEDTRNWTRHLEPWGKTKRLAEITQADVKTLHTHIGKDSGTYAANRVLALLSGMFSKSGKDFGIDPRDNPGRGVTRFEEKERDRVLKPEEIRAVLAAIEQADPTIRDFVKVSLFTGARRSNVLGMKWEDVNLKRAEWKLPGEVTKNGQPMVIALAPQLVELLKSRPDHSPYVFPAQRITPEQVAQVKELQATGATTRDIADKVKLSQTTVCRLMDPKFNADEPRHLSPPRKAWDDVLKAAGITERTTCHDLRRSFASAMINAGASLTVVADALGHKDFRTTQKYYAWANAATVKKATLAGVEAITNAQAELTEKKVG